MTERDVYYMKKALALARRGGRAVRPNPRVGAVLVKNGKVLAAAYHSFFGGPHAELKVLKKAGAQAKGATLYVNLEPCSSYGKTPPCTAAIKASGVKKVVIGCLDHNPKNRNRAGRILKKAGVQVVAGVWEKECCELNRDFFIWAEKKRPYSILKLALSLDGKIATRNGNARWISSKESRRFAHYLRGQADAVLVGLHTILADDPRLSARMGYHNPHLKKVILDSKGKIPFSARVLKGKDRADTIVVTTPIAPPKRMMKFVEKGTTWLKVPSKKGRVSLKSLMGKLAGQGVIKLLIEGGGEVAASALKEGLVDEIHFIIAPLIIGGKKAPTAVGGRGVAKIKKAYKLVDVTVKKLGPDIHVYGRIAHRE